MAAKPVLAFESDVAAGGLAPASRRTVFEQMVRRVTGDGLLNLIRARAEVMAALRGGEISPEAGLDDALPIDAIPSVAAGRSENRVLAEIDQDGFAFAVDPLDEAYVDAQGAVRDRRVERDVPRDHCARREARQRLELSEPGRNRSERAPIRVLLKIQQERGGEQAPAWQPRGVLRMLP
jgi:hypothetical protein